MSYGEDGVLEKEEIEMPSEKRLNRGPVAIIECVENIPCNPCVDACPFDAITMERIIDLPEIDHEKCTGCRSCVAICPGLAIFVVDLSREGALITLPYEFLPVPRESETVKALNRRGDEIGEVRVVKVRENRNRTTVVTIEARKDLAMDVRNIRVSR